MVLARSLGAQLAQLLLLLSAPVSAHPAKSCSVGKAIYLLTNDQQNAVVALPIGANGHLSKGHVTATGGSGGVHVDATGAAMTPDSLLSQSSITIAGKYIFAVNAGSNSLSMLSISSFDATKLSLVGEPITVPGDFPNTVAVSEKHGIVCVGTTGAKAGVSCGTFSHHGLGPLDELRPFSLMQTTPPSGPPNTVSQVYFSEDEKLLLVNVKGNPTTNNTGFLAAYAVEKHCGAYGYESSGKKVSSKATKSQPKGTALLFGTDIIPGTNRLLVSDPSFGAAIISIDEHTHTAKTVSLDKVPGQQAACWAIVHPATRTGFLGDAGRDTLVELSLKDASVVSTLDFTGNHGNGLFDLGAAGDFVYGLSAGTGKTDAAVVVFDVSKKSGANKLVQRFSLTGLAGTRADGLAVLI